MKIQQQVIEIYFRQHLRDVKWKSECNFWYIRCISTTNLHSYTM